MSENHIEFDILKHDISVTMEIPDGRTMVLVSLKTAYFLIEIETIQLHLLMLW